MNVQPVIAFKKTHKNLQLDNYSSSSLGRLHPADNIFLIDLIVLLMVVFFEVRSSVA